MVVAIVAAVGDPMEIIHATMTIGYETSDLLDATGRIQSCVKKEWPGVLLVLILSTEKKDKEYYKRFFGNAIDI